MFFNFGPMHTPQGPPGAGAEESLFPSLNGTRFLELGWCDIYHLRTKGVSRFTPPDPPVCFWDGTLVILNLDLGCCSLTQRVGFSEVWWFFRLRGLGEGRISQTSYMWRV